MQTPLAGIKKFCTREERMTRMFALICSALLLWPSLAAADVEVIKIPRGAGGFGFLPLLVMERQGLIEAKAKEAGIGTLRVEWIKLGGPALVNDLLLSGAADVVGAGPPAFLTLWDRTREGIGVKGIAGMTSVPMYLNTRAPHLKSLKDLAPTDKIAITAVKVSIPAIIMQMAAIKEFGAAEFTRYDQYTVGLTHPDALIALLSGSAGISAHFASPPFHQRERKAADVRTILTSNEVMGGPSTFTMLYATTKFHDDNPKVYGALVKALQEAIAFINADKRGAAQIFLEMEGQGMKLDEILEVLNDPDMRFTTSPENVMKYAEFMAGVGSLKQRPATWQDMFFPAIHGVPGN
jgi:NitT/TauT family transport system substrate-binding protein